MRAVYPLIFSVALGFGLLGPGMAQQATPVAPPLPLALLIESAYDAPCRQGENTAITGKIEQGRVSGPLCFAVNLLAKLENPRPAETTAWPE